MTTAACVVALSVVPLAGKSQLPPPASKVSMDVSKDSLIELYHATLLSLRDTIASLNSRLSHLRRQLKSAGPESILRWTAEANQRCLGTLASLEAAEPKFRRAGRDRVSTAARTFADTLSRTGSVLRKHCVVGIVAEGPGEWADSVRAWVPYHVGMLERQLANYHREAARFAKVAGFRLEPRMPTRGD